MTTTTERRIYVACLACYNAGHLVGAWVDAADAPSFGIASLRHAPDVCPHEETAIHDFEGFAGIRLGEFESLDDVAKLADLLDDHGDAFAAWYENESRDLSDDLAEMFREAFQGEFRSEADYAESYCDDCGVLRDVPEELRRYFDYESYGRDLFMGDLWSTPAGGGGIYVFQSC